MHAQNNGEIVIRQEDTLVDIQTYGFVAVHADTVLAVRCRKLNEYLEIWRIVRKRTMNQRIPRTLGIIARFAHVEIGIPVIRIAGLDRESDAGTEWGW